jgi:Protein of unknown function (DUF2793)
MPDDTTILSLPLILPAQAQKHVTHNEALVALDLIVQLAVLNRTLTSAPALPSVGDRHIVSAGATGPWAGQAGRIALFSETGWQFTQALPGWRAHVLAEGQTAVFDGVAWKTLSESPLTVPQLGVAATADAVNRLAVAAPATLLNHAGSGHQLKLNKATAADTASLLFQTGFGGRAEMGTAGADDFSVKVSADGSGWFTALEADAATGEVTLPEPLHLGGQVADPASPTDGTFWLNTTTGEVKVRSGGVTLPLGGGGMVGDGDKGDITVSGGGAVWTVDPGAITLAKLASVPSDSFLGRDTAGTGVPEVLTPALARGILNVADGATANAADSALRDRATHTGTQPASSVTGLAAVATSGSASDLGAGTLPAARFSDAAHGSRAGGTLHPDATTTVSGFMSGADKTKLNGVATGATANSPDATLLARANHTGTQPAATISDFSEAVDDRVGGLLVAGANITLTYNDPANTLTIAAAGGGGATNLTYDSATRVIASDTGTDATLPLVTSANAGLAPASGGGTTNYLRADGTWAAPGGGGATDLTYDIPTRLLSSSTGTDVTLPPDSGPARFHAFNDMTNGVSDGVWLFSQSGTGAGVTNGSVLADGGLGWVQFNLGTTATGRAACHSQLGVMRLGLGAAHYACRVRQLVLSDAVNATYTERFGFLDSVTAESTDGAFFRYTHSVNGGRFQAVTRSNSVETAVDTGTTVAINTTYKLEVIANAAGTSVEFAVNGALVATITTNIPIGAGRETGAGLMLLRSVGTVSTNPVTVDYLQLEQSFTTGR